jgi:hypothetical protein
MDRYPSPEQPLLLTFDDANGPNNVAVRQAAGFNQPGDLALRDGGLRYPLPLTTCTWGGGWSL